MMVAPLAQNLPTFRPVRDRAGSILPGYYGLEAANRPSATS